MEVHFKDDKLDQLERDAGFTGSFSQAIVRAYRRRMQSIRAAMDERDFYKNKGMHFEKLQGPRSHQHSMKLNDQFRLVIEWEDGKSGKSVVIVGIEDYH